MPPEDNVNPLRFNEVTPIANVVVPKSRLLNQPPVSIVAADAPLINVKLGALVAEPPAVVPNVNLLPKLIVLTKPPVPVQVKPVAVAILKLLCEPVRFANTILLVPKLIERVFVLFEIRALVV